MNLNRVETEILVEFLDDLGNKMHNAGCNDYEVEATEDNLKMFQEFTKADGYTDETANDAPWRVSSGRIVTFDWWVCAHIRRKIRNYLTQTTGGG